ncbi:hypothetical protein WJX74_005287 [Apatococcus lobatus]|uniref:Aquaporin n=1 Tax=Apatococcus lobatus TaxID=904363 RepID=A0AAW1QJM4_9CHLO
MLLWEPISPEFVRGIIMEFMGMILFLFCSIGTVCFSCNSSSALSVGSTGAATCDLSEPRVLVIAFAFGISIFTLIYLVAPFSGGHLNPAVTVGLLVGGRVTLLRAVCFVPAQIAGATVGVAFVKAVSKTNFAIAGGGANALAGGATYGGAWTMETILTFGLVFIVFAATDAGRSRIVSHLTVLAPMAVGFWVFLSHLVAIPIDGCSINPARTFGAAAVSGNWAQHWLYWAGPMAGAIFASLFYSLFMEPIAMDLVDMDAYPVKLPAFPGKGTMRERNWSSLKEEIVTPPSPEAVGNENGAEPPASTMSSNMSDQQLRKREADPSHLV